MSRPEIERDSGQKKLKIFDEEEKKMKKRVILILIMVHYCLSLNSYAMPLGEIHYIKSSFGGNTIDTTVTISWDNSITPEGVDRDAFMSWEVMSFDVGKTFHQSADTSENFNLYASMLTSGTDDTLNIWCCLTSGMSGDGHMESQWLNKFVPTQSNDFYGYEITGIDLTVNSLTINSPGTNPNHDGIWTDVTGDFTFTIHGIPEPATLLLFALGVPILSGLRRKH